jgi:hypothetical protein
MDMKLIKELNTIENNVIGAMEEVKTGVLDVKGKPMTKTQRTGGYGANLSEADLKDIIQKIDNSIDWGLEGADKFNQALESLRVGIDRILKSRNPLYEQIMKPEADLIGLSKEMKRSFGLKKEVGQELTTPSNTTQNKIIQASNPKNMLTRATLKKVGDYIGQDLLQQIDDVGVKHQFEIARPQGSKRTNIGLGVGSSIGTGLGYLAGGGQGAVTGGSIGGLAGTLAGSSLDTGGPALAKIIDKWASLRGTPLQSYGTGKMLKYKGK